MPFVNRPLFPPPSPELLETACRVSAEATLRTVAADPALELDQRIGVIGDYMISCLFASKPETGVSGWEEVCREGLTHAGASEEVVEELNTTYIRKRGVQRIVFSLAYLRDNAGTRGVIKKDKSVTIADETAFLRGVIERAQQDA
ncbi:MAG: hypothetical protein V4702_02305 [Patescibacteria group bacterium]